MVWIMEKVVNKAETKVLHASLSTLRRLTCSRERVHVLLVVVVMGFASLSKHQVGQVTT